MRFSGAIALLVTSLLVTTALASAVQQDSTVGHKTAGPRSSAIDAPMKALMQRVSQNITTDYLRSELENLTAFKTRYCHASNHVQVLDWIFDQFKAMGYSPKKWGFVYGGDPNLANIIVNVNGTGSSQYYIVGAHLDTINFSKSWSFPDAPAPGADDDGTGIVAMLAMAKVLEDYHFYYGIRFIAFDVEELDHAQGSLQYAHNITDSGEGKGLRAVIDMDMLGYNPSFIRMDVTYVPSSSSLVTDYLLPANNQFSYIGHLFTDLEPNNPNEWVDADIFWNLGYQGLCFEEAVNPHQNWSNYTINDNMHTGNDTIDKINWELFTNTTKLVLTTLMMMAKPTLPDLSVKSIVFPKGPFFEGDNVTMNVTVSNLGNLDATKARVDLILDKKPLLSTNLSVPFNSSVSFVYPWNSTSGDHIFVVATDPKDMIGEWNESNNNATAVETILIRPDMALENFSIDRDHVNNSEQAHLSVKVINHGPYYIGCWLNITDNRTSEMVASDQVGLTTGKEWSHTYNWSSTINGTHRLEGRLTSCSPADKNETNDHLDAQIIVNGYPVAGLSVDPQNGALTFDDLVFSGAGSYDDQGLADYNFTFGDGNFSGWTNSSVVKHNYSKAGTYEVKLVVKDRYGALSTKTSLSINISDRPPVAVAKVTQSLADTGVPITFLSAGSKDPDGTIVQYYWSILSTGQFSNKANLSVNFPRSGNYTAMLTVTDDNGNTASASISVQIRNRAPKATISAPCSIQAGKLAQFNASGSNDTDGTIVSFSWNFGDNFTSSEKVATHTYINPGTYKVTLTVMDNEKSLGTATWNITVLKKPSVPVKNTTADSGIWVFGLCVAVLLVFVIYISAPGRSKPRKKGTLMHKPKKPRTRKKKSS